jgi:bacterial/archaeal transporter family-2 protein
MNVFLLLALLIGVVLPLQAGVNAQLRVGLGHPLLAAATSFAVGTVALIVCAAAVRAPIPGAAALARLPWWYWTGGLLGAVYVLAAVVLAPRLGAANLVAAVVAGQLVASLVLDHFGLVGYPRFPITLARVAGVALLLAGLLLIQRK